MSDSSRSNRLFTWEELSWITGLTIEALQDLHRRYRGHESPPQTLGHEAAQTLIQLASVEDCWIT